jgi:putative cell wall-binding protein
MSKLTRHAVALAAAVALVSGSSPAGAAPSVTRAAGSDRIGTAVAASRAFHGASTEAVLATAGAFPDALAAGALAARLQAPVLLTWRDSLPSVVADELRRLGVRTVWILGGTRAVSSEVETTLLTSGYAVRRLAGDSRYSTAREVAASVGRSPTGEVAVALGDHTDPDRAWADALAAGALAAAPHYVPVLLTRPDSLPEETGEALADLDPDDVLLLGGPAAISSHVEDELRRLGHDVRRVAGASRYATSVALAGTALDRTDGPVTAVFASGEDFPDALSASAVATAVQGPLVLVPSRSLDAHVDRFLRDHAHRWSGGVVLGGPAAVDDAVLQQLTRALRDEPEAEPEPQGELVVSVFEGEASWYGGSLAGETTACGETFDPTALTAAHRELPCGARVRLTNTANGNQVIVRINDRGPHSDARVLDVSEEAANRLGFLQEGTAWVRGEVLEG